MGKGKTGIILASVGLLGAAHLGLNYQAIKGEVADYQRNAKQQVLVAQAKESCARVAPYILDSMVLGDRVPIDPRTKGLDDAFLSDPDAAQRISEHIDGEIAYLEKHGIADVAACKSELDTYVLLSQPERADSQQQLDIYAPPTQLVTAYVWALNGLKDALSNYEKAPGSDEARSALTAAFKTAAEYADNINYRIYDTADPKTIELTQSDLATEKAGLVKKFEMQGAEGVLSLSLAALGARLAWSARGRRKAEAAETNEYIVD